MDRFKKSWRTLLICSLLAGATLATFWPVRHAGFITLDDPQYVTENPHLTDGLTWGNVVWTFQSRYAYNWHPLTWLSHILDVQLFGLRPGGHHLTNLLLHTSNSVLLFLLLRRMTGDQGRSAFVAALFALHPLHVESVAWVAERKDLLSGFFFMLTLLAYARYAEGRSQKSEVRRQKSDALPFSFLHPPSSFFYGLALVCFALGLMSKPMLVTLPFVLLLLDYWPLNRSAKCEVGSAEFRGGRSVVQSSMLVSLMLEKSPFFALSAVSSAITLVVQQGAMMKQSACPVGYRFANSALAYMDYLRHTFWPTGLAIFYPYPVYFSKAAIAATTVLLATITAVCLALARRWPYAVVGWLWYLGMLVPVIGIVQVGSQQRADRYTYLPLIGIFIAVTWAVAALIAECRVRSAESKDQRSPGPSDLTCHASRITLSSITAGCVLVALALTAHRQAGYWRTSRALFQHAAQVTEGNYVAWGGLGIADLRAKDPVSAMTNLAIALECAEPRGAAGGIKYFIGVALQMEGKGLEALPCLQQSEPLPELRSEKNYRLGLSLIEAGRLAEAETVLKQALEAKPQNPDFQMGMAALLHSQKKDDRAEQIYREVAAAHPNLASAHRSYGDFLLLANRPAEAEVQYAAALKLEKPDVRLLKSVASALTSQGKAAEVVKRLEEALKLEPSDAKANFDLAELLCQQGRSREAVGRYAKAIESNPKSIRPLNNLAWVLATDPDAQVRNGARAVELAERACQLTGWQQPFFMGTLAAAYAEAGRFEDAVAMAEKARDKARADKLDAVAKKNGELLELYRAGKPYREQ